MRISRMAPEAATPRVVARTAGLLTAMGGLAAMALVLGSPGGLSEMHPFVIGIAPSTTLLGLAVIRWGHLVPRAFFQVLLVVGAVVVVLRGDIAAGPAGVLGVLVLGSARAIGVLVQRAASADRDALTGLVNRRGFDEALDDAVRMALWSGQPLSAALFDLDYFKAVNDSKGHAAGDEMLRAVAAAWVPLLPRGAVLARHGGHEFSLLLPETDGDAALVWAERLRAALPDIGTSVGVAEFALGDSPADLMRRADVALYRVKSLGRGRSELDAGGQSPLARDLAAALAAGVSGGLSVHLQPIVTPADGAIAGVEALVRWTHLTRGPVAPDEFVPVAEQEGLIGAVGSFVWTAACRDASVLALALGRPIFLTVNVSGLELDDPGFPTACWPRSRRPAGRPSGPWSR